MARKKNPAESVRISSALSARLRAIREELFGKHGGPELARRLGIPARSWYNYETGVTIPAEVLLGFIEQTGANTTYLATGEGPKYAGGDSDQAALIELLRRMLKKLEQGDAKPALSYEQREALSDALRVDRNRVEDRAWDVADVMGIVEAFLDGKPVKEKPTPKVRAKQKRNEDK